MERINLSKKKKALLRYIANGEGNAPKWANIVEVSYTATALERHGLIAVMWASGHEYVSARLTDFGKYYLAVNPDLRNPIDWYAISQTALQTINLMLISFLIYKILH